MSSTASTPISSRRRVAPSASTSAITGSLAESGLARQIGDARLIEDLGHAPRRLAPAPPDAAAGEQTAHLTALVVPAVHLRRRPLEHVDDLTHRDLARRTGQQITAVRPAHTLHQAGLAQLHQELP